MTGYRRAFAVALAAAVVSALTALAGCTVVANVLSAIDGGNPGQGSSDPTGADSGNGGVAPSSSGSGSGAGSSSGSSGGGGSGSSSGASSGDGDGSTAQPPSCAPGGPGMSNCGSASESCCTSLEVPGGTFYRTYDDANGALAPDGGPTALADPATISGLRIDKYDVTVGRFRQFVNAWDGGAGWQPPLGSGKHTHLNGGQGLVNSGAPADAGIVYETGWSTAWTGEVAPTSTNLNCANSGDGGPYAWATWTPSPGTQENLPINCVNWYEAYAFCIWDGAFLPSEAEWEYTAAGGSEQREYPWGSTQPGTACPGTGCSYADYECNYPSGPGNCGGATSAANIAPVGTATLGAGLWGQLDLAGEVWQWNLDRDHPYVDPCTDCAYLPSVSVQVIRGGGWDGFGTTGLQPTYRDFAVAYSRYYDRGDVGFRCARPPPGAAAYDGGGVATGLEAGGGNPEEGGDDGGGQELDSDGAAPSCPATYADVPQFTQCSGFVSCDYPEQFTCECNQSTDPGEWECIEYDCLCETGDGGANPGDPAGCINQTCTTDTDCPSGQHCGLTGWGAGVCSVGCETSQSSCPVGSRCWGFAP